MDLFTNFTNLFKGKGSLSINSTEEEVSQFFFEHKIITEKVKKNIIKENINGLALKLLEDEDYTFLEISPKIKDKIKEYLESNKKNFILKPNKITLKFDSNKEEVIDFCENELSFKGNLSDDINGKKLLTLSEQEMKALGLNLGQRKKLLYYIKCINNFYKKVLKEFLKKELKWSDEIIKTFDLNEDQTFLLIEEKINSLNFSKKKKKEKKT
jgi:hypothetical protein